MSVKVIDAVAIDNNQVHIGWRVTAQREDGSTFEYRVPDVKLDALMAASDDGTLTEGTCNNLLLPDVSKEPRGRLSDVVHVIPTAEGHDVVRHTIHGDEVSREHVPVGVYSVTEPTAVPSDKLATLEVRHPRNDDEDMKNVIDQVAAMSEAEKVQDAEVSESLGEV